MWRMDSLSVGISILCCGGKGPSYLGCGLSVAHAYSPPPSDHDRLEIAITIGWNRRSRCSGMSDHDGLERVITIVWNQ
jgi:hypothetical protein